MDYDDVDVGLDGIRTVAELGTDVGPTCSGCGR